MLANCSTSSTKLFSRFAKLLSSTSMSNQIGAFSSACASNNYKITDNVGESRFEMIVGDEEVAYIEYSKENNTYDLTESLVPDELTGKGLGKILARNTFDHIISQDGKMKLTCDFLQYYYKQNEDKYKGHIV